MFNNIKVYMSNVPILKHFSLCFVPLCNNFFKKKFKKYIYIYINPHTKIIINLFFALEICYHVHITDCIIDHFKIRIHVIKIRKKTENIQWWFHQRKSIFVIQIVYTESRSIHFTINFSINWHKVTCPLISLRISNVTLLFRFYITTKTLLKFVSSIIIHDMIRKTNYIYIPIW